MEELEGGTITTRHRYVVGRRARSAGALVVYEGTRDPFERPVWIHVYDLGEDNEALEVRIIEDAQAAAALDERGALRTLDHGQLGEGLPFVVTERARGTTLHALLDEQGTLSPDEVATLAGALARALDHAHALGAIHGALSTHTVYVPDGDLANARIGHFGTGLTLDEQNDLEVEVLEHAALAALPPEMCKGITPTPTPASDVWALGAILYTCLTGFHPFFPDDDDPEAGLDRIRDESARPLDELGFDPDLSDVIADAIDPAVDARHPDAGSLAREIADIVGLSAAPAPKPRPRTSPSAPAPAPAGDGARSSLDDLPGQEPDARGTVAFVAILALVASNIAWWLSSAAGVAPAPTVAPTEEPTEQPRAERLFVLPQGLQLDSEPAGAKIFVVRPDGSDSLLGEAPQVINPALPQNQTMRLKVQAEGHRSVLMDVERRDDGQDVTLVLERTP